MACKVVHCKREPYDVYIGRPSKWGNPYPLSDEGEREEVVELYRRYLWRCIKEGSITRSEMVELVGKTLGCWCTPKPCHGDILCKAVQWAKNTAKIWPYSTTNKHDMAFYYFCKKQGDEVNIYNGQLYVWLNNKAS